MKVAVPLSKNVLVPLVTMTSASTIYGAIQKKKKKICVEEKFGKTLKSLEILWNWLSAKFSIAFYAFISK